MIIAFPTEYEAGAYVARLARREKIVNGYRGEANGKPVTVLICGMGAKMSAHRIEQHLAQRREAAEKTAHTPAACAATPLAERGIAIAEDLPGDNVSATAIPLSARGVVAQATGVCGVVILAGFAGALVSELKRNQIIIAAGHGIVPGAKIVNLHTADKVIATPEEKRALAAATGAAAVDMETTAVAPVAAKYNRDFLAIRVISDELTDPIPAATLSHGYDEGRGVTTPLRMATHLATHPHHIPALLRFLRPLAPARRALADFLFAL